MNSLKEDELISLIKRNEQKKKRRTYISILIIVIAALIFVVYTSLSISKNEEKTQKIAITKDSLEVVNLNLKKEQSKEKIIQAKVSLFLKRRFFQSLDSVKSLFTDTLERYYIQLNLPFDQMLEGDKKFWKKFPDEKFNFDSTSIAINTVDTSGIKALIRAFYCREKNDCKEIVQELRFNDNYKIYYVRAFDVAK